jgi:hypothetical protein
MRTPWQLELPAPPAGALFAFNDIPSEGKAKIGAAMLPGPEGSWGMPSEIIAELPGYGGDVDANRAKAQSIMQALGYGPGNPLKVKVATRNIALYRDPAVILIDQLKRIYVEGELDDRLQHLVCQGGASRIFDWPQPDRCRHR